MFENEEEDEPSYFEYVITDHLGNGRVWFADLDGDGEISREPEDHEIRQEKHYYPFGLHMDHPDFWVDYPEGDRYQYNSIENVNISNALLYAAHYRTLDPGLGRWMQVDPAAEKYHGLTPYNSMANNPFSFNDPDGDDFGLSLLIGAGIGILANGLQNSANNQSFFKNWGQAAFMGAWSGAAGFGIGQAFGGIAGSTIGNELGRAAAHGLVGGFTTEAQGGSFWHGFLSGGIGSGIGSSIGAWGNAAGWSQTGTDIALIGGGAFSGGISSSIAGGGFWQGFGTAATVGVVNHAMAHVLSGGTDPPEGLPDGRKLWDLSDKEFEMFHTPEGRRALFGGDFDIQLSVSERTYWYAKQLGLAAPTAKVLGFGKTMFNSKLFGYKSPWFGRRHPHHLPDGVKGNLNQGNLRTGWGWNNNTGRHTFRTGVWDTGRHFDWFSGPRY